MSDPLTDPNAFRVENIDPPDADFRKASQATRMKYYTRVGHFAATAKDRDLAAGLDKNGHRLRPITAETRKARQRWDYSPMGQASPNAPPLMATYDKSRTRSLLRWKAYDGFVLFFWAYDVHTGRPWGEILNYHREGKRPLPKRDVIGLSATSLATVKRQAFGWWRGVAGVDEGAERDRIRRVVGPGGVVAPKSGRIADFRTGHQQLRDGRFRGITPTRHVDFLAGVGFKEE
jgi:hypothetical protein